MKKREHKGDADLAAEHLVREAQEETDPFMRKLFLFTAAGIAAQAALDAQIKGKRKRRHEKVE